MLLVVFGITTYNRVHVWQTNLSLFEDTVKKNPNFAPIRNEYAVALFKKGRKEEAMRQLSIAIKLAKGTPYILPELNKAILEGQSRDELKVLKESLGRKDIKPRLKVQLLERIISIYQKKLISKEEVIDRKQRQEIYENLISYYTELYRLTQKGFYQYRLGQLYLTLGDKRRALESFKEAIRSSPNEYFSPAARKLINHLQLEIEREKIH
jgi:tetratricopeptide (TPR) repeat protein